MDIETLTYEQISSYPEFVQSSIMRQLWLSSVDRAGKRVNVNKEVTWQTLDEIFAEMPPIPVYANE